MKCRQLMRWSLVLALLIAPNMALGAGFAQFDQGARATSMGKAFVAQADDPSALYYNPAGLVQLEVTQAMDNVTVIMPNHEFTSTTSTPGLGTHYGKTSSMLEDQFYIPSLYLTSKYNDKVAWGIGAFGNFGIVADWPDNWDGRYTPWAWAYRLANGWRISRTPTLMTKTAILTMSWATIYT